MWMFYSKQVDWFNCTSLLPFNSSLPHLVFWFIANKLPGIHDLWWSDHESDLSWNVSMWHQNCHFSSFFHQNYRSKVVTILYVCISMCRPYRNSQCEFIVCSIPRLVKRNVCDYLFEMKLTRMTNQNLAHSD